MANEEHPFAAYVRILARGKTKSRPFTEEEAEAAMGMILAGDVRPEQLGAFLMLLRFKEETPEEIAGFVRAARAAIKTPDNMPKVDLDWSSYAGKRRQLPWFLLSVLLLSQNGIRILMHGTEGHTPGRVYTRDVLDALDLPVTSSLADAASAIETSNFAYLPLEAISPQLKKIIDLKSVLGLRSPVHTIARLLNPFNAPCVLQGIFHRGFMETHQRAAQLLGQPHMAVFRGDGGEIECRPNKPTDVWTVHDGQLGASTWPALLGESRQPLDEDMNVTRLIDVWRGTDNDDYARAAIIGTAAIALETLGRVTQADDAIKEAQSMWHERDTSRLGKAA